MNATTKELCVVHLVRMHNGIEPFRRFLDSYRENPGGIDHDLLIVFKGFKCPQDFAEHVALLASFRYLKLDISDAGFDITAYFAALSRYSAQYRYFCFLNSFSVIQDHDWLNKLHRYIIQSGIGMVGASGSWQSHRVSMSLNTVTEGVSRIRQEEGSLFHILIVKFALFLRQVSYLPYFDPAPNYHLRTNAFMISSYLMKKLRFPSIHTKLDAYRFESGKNGFTKQILNMGEKVIVVGKDGIGYEKENWHTSKTFWQSEQENLLVADNQTRDYQNGSAERRRNLRSLAWGVENARSGSSKE